MQNEEWVTMAEAAKRLKMSKSTVSRIVRRNNIPTRADTIDTRLLLVEYNELHRVVLTSVKYRD